MSTMVDKKNQNSKELVVRNNVQFVGLNILDPAEQERIKEIIYKDFITLERELKNINGLKLHFKEYKNKGGNKKYSVQMVVKANTGSITVNKMSSPLRWDPVAITHKLIDKARQQVIHKYKTDSNYRKSYEKGVL